MYKVYIVDANAHYYGFALVAANSAEEANSFINKFKESDKDNVYDSRGYDVVHEYDVIEDIWAERDGIIHYGIRYGG